MNRVMKDSGIEWIGEIPKEWDLRRIKTLFSIVAGATPKSGEPTFWNGDIPWITPADFTTEDVYVASGHKEITQEGLDSCATTLIPAESIIFSKRAPVGLVAINRKSLCTNQGCLSCIPKENIATKYYYYAMSVFAEQFNMLATGTTFKEIAAEVFCGFILPYPHIGIQKRISSYLDKKCAEIDSLIASKEKTNSLLKEWRQSIIYEAVTKGLDSNVPMKDSGIEWIGKIPENWDVVRIKYILDESEYGIKIGPFGSALSNRTLLFGAYCVYSQANLITNDFSEANHYIDRETFEMLQNYEVAPGDICVSMMGTIGKCKEVPIGIKQGIMDSHLIKIRLNNNKVNSGYFEYVYDKDYSGVCFTQMKYDKKGTIMDGLNTSIVKNLFIPLPPLSVQKKIASNLDKKCEKIDSAIKKNTEIVEKLKEYRQSLIYEAVTGKICINEMEKK